MSDEKPRSGPGARSPAAGGTPPKLERVPAGYTPPATVRPASPAPVRAPEPTPRAPGASSYGLAAREVGADAAIAAGIAHEGLLATDGALRLFALAAATHATGRLTIAQEGRSYALGFRRGTVEHAASTDPADDLGRFLHAKGTLAAEALARAEVARVSTGGDLVTALIAQRLVNPADVAALLQEHGARIVQRALALESGAWRWEPSAPAPPGAFPLGSPFAMLCAAVRALDAVALTRRLGEREHRVASRVAGRVGLEDLRLTPQETRAAGLFDGSHSPAEIAARAPAEALIVLRLALLLGEVELLAFDASRKGAPSAHPTAAAAEAERPPAGPQPEPAPISAAPAAAKPATGSTPPVKPAPPARPAAPPKAVPGPPPPRPAAAPPPPPKAAAPVPLDDAALQALYARLKDADHFTVLGVKQDAPASQIKVAYFQLAKAYHPDAVPAAAPAETRALCADVFAKVSEAWSVLGEDAPRAAYLERLRSGGTAEVDVMAILQAENVFQDGTLLVKARKYDEALRKFEEATKLNPDEAEFGMWKAWCEFVLADDKRKKVGACSSIVEEGLRKNPRCAQGYLFLGQMAKLAGDLALAEKQLRRGLHVAPEHADMQRELKYLRK